MCQKNQKKLVLFIGVKEPKRTKYHSTIGYDSTFSDYGNTFSDIVMPGNVMGAYDFYKKYLEPNLKKASSMSKEASVKAQLAGLRPQAELVLDANALYAKADSLDGSCTGNNVNSLLAKPTFKTALMSISDLVGIGNMKCYSTTTAWAVSVKMPESNEYYRTDNMGVSSKVGNHIVKMHVRISFRIKCFVIYV